MTKSKKPNLVTDTKAEPVFEEHSKSHTVFMEGEAHKTRAQSNTRAVKLERRRFRGSHALAASTGCLRNL